MKNKTLKNLCVCAVCVALAMALSYLKIPIGAGFGGWGGLSGGCVTVGFRKPP